MSNRRRRPLFLAAFAIAAVWLLAWGGYTVAKNSKATVEKARAYSQSVDLRRLSGKPRADAINKLAAILNALSAEERQQTRVEGVWQHWLEQMTETERSAFIEATTPAGLMHMLTAFDRLPEDRRRRAIAEALKRLKELRENLRETGHSLPTTATNRPPVIIPEMEKRVREVGLKAAYSESSSQTKAALSPILEELQRMMDSGVIARTGPR